MDHHQPRPLHQRKLRGLNAQRQDGRVVSKRIRTISRDGKTMTENTDYTNAQGQRVNNVLVFEKQ